MAQVGSLFTPIPDLPGHGWWRLSQWDVAQRSTTESHSAWYYPTAADYNPPGTFAIDAHKATMGDFNGDGLQDLVISWAVFPHTLERSTYLFPTVLLNVGGELQPVSDEAFPETMLRHFGYKVTIGRFNNDTLDDFAIAGMGVITRLADGSYANRWEPAMLALSAQGPFQDASDRLEGQSLTQAAPGASFMHDMAAGDLNSDGIDDIFAGGKLWISRSDGTWEDLSHLIPFSLSARQPMDARIGDLNGDGHNDILALMLDFSLERSVFVSDGAATPSFTRINLPPSVYGNNGKDNNSAIVDINRDGLNDIVIAATRKEPYYLGSAIQILMQTAPGVFEDQTGTRVNNTARDGVHGEGELFAVDANGDGAPDIIHTTSNGDDGLAIYLNDGAGTFNLMDRTLFPFIQRSQLQSWENVPDEGFSGNRAYPIHIDADGIIDFVVQMQRPFTQWPQVEPTVVSLYTMASNGTAFNRHLSEVIQGSAIGDKIFGLEGNDILHGLGENDTLDGGAGLDNAVFRGPRSDYQVTRGVSGDWLVSDLVNGRDGSDVLRGIERLTFSNKSVALDLAAGEGANHTARIICAAFDAQTLTERPDYVGIGLQLFENGVSVADVCQLAVTVMGDMSASAFVDRIYFNVVGSKPSSVEHAMYLSWIDGDTAHMSRAQLLSLAASTDATAVKVNLIGLQGSGLDFV